MIKSKKLLPKIGVAGCRVTTRDLIHDLMDLGYPIEALITIPPKIAKQRYHISGYDDLSNLAQKNNITLCPISDYSLKKSEDDKSKITNLGLDILIVLGWQRIIPAWLLEILDIGAFGMHGGPLHPPKGRGHSVINWSLIEGKRSFNCYLFKYVEKIDAGPIVASKSFDITHWDTCETLHFKYQLSMVTLLREHMPALLSKTAKLLPQRSSGATYYPKRVPEDGLINWNNEVTYVHNFVKALTAPYPGAFAYFEKKKVVIWDAQPFDKNITWNKKPGTILKVFYNAKFLVQTRHYALLVNRYEGARLKKSDERKILG